MLQFLVQVMMITSGLSNKYNKPTAQESGREALTICGIA
jgi:hypothetical protein